MEQEWSADPEIYTKWYEGGPKIEIPNGEVQFIPLPTVWGWDHEGNDCDPEDSNLCTVTFCAQLFQQHHWENFGVARFFSFPYNHRGMVLNQIPSRKMLQTRDAPDLFKTLTPANLMGRSFWTEERWAVLPHLIRNQSLAMEAAMLEDKSYLGDGKHGHKLVEFRMVGKKELQNVFKCYPGKAPYLVLMPEDRTERDAMVFYDQEYDWCRYLHHIECYGNAVPPFPFEWDARNS